MGGLTPSDIDPAVREPYDEAIYASDRTGTSFSRALAALTTATGRQGYDPRTVRERRHEGVVFGTFLLGALQRLGYTNYMPDNLSPTCGFWSEAAMRCLCVVIHHHACGSSDAAFRPTTPVTCV